MLDRMYEFTDVQLLVRFRRPIVPSWIAMTGHAVDAVDSVLG